MKFAVVAALGAGLALQPGQLTNYKGLEIAPISVERAENVPLLDCPPGTNSQRGNARDGQEFAVVTLSFKVTPAFKDVFVKKPVMTAASGKTFNTSVAIIDPASVSEYQCSFPFRVPTGTKVASVQIDTATISLEGLEKK